MVGSKWQNFKEIFVSSWRQTNALFSRSLLRTTILMLLINFAIQFGYYGLWLWFPELFNRLELYYKAHPDDSVTVCEVIGIEVESNTTTACVEHIPDDQVF